MVNCNPMGYGYSVRWQSDIVNTTESELPVCDKPYHTSKGKLQKREKIEVLWNYPLAPIIEIIDSYALWRKTSISFPCCDTRKKVSAITWWNKMRSCAKFNKYITVYLLLY